MADQTTNYASWIQLATDKHARQSRPLSPPDDPLASLFFLDLADDDFDPDAVNNRPISNVARMESVTVVCHARESIFGGRARDLQHILLLSCTPLDVLPGIPDLNDGQHRVDTKL